MADPVPVLDRWRARMRRVRGRLSGARPHPAPVFLLGHPKSGTTAIAGLLARATGCEVTHDLFQTYGIARAEAADVIMGRTPMAAFVARHPYAFAAPLQKCPKLTFAFEALRGHFPDSRFAAIVRDPRDTIRSFLFRRGLPGDAEQLPRRLDLLPDGLTGHYIAQLAERWNRAADVAIANKGDVVLIRYEDFARDKIGEIGRLADRLGLTVSHDISPWLTVPFKPYSAAADWETFFGAVNLARIEEACGARMRQLDYTASPPARLAV